MGDIELSEFLRNSKSREDLEEGQISPSIPRSPEARSPSDRSPEARAQRRAYSRSIKGKCHRRVQRTRSRSLPAIPPGSVRMPVPNPDSQSTDNPRIRSFSTTMKGIVNNGDLRKDSRRDSGVSTGRRSSLASIASSRRDSAYSVISSVPRQDSVFSDPTHSRRTSVVGNRRASCISEGDYVRLRSGIPYSWPGSQDSVTALDEDPETYRVVVFGAQGTGKTAIVNQFTTSEFMGASDMTSDESDEEKTSISVILNKEESVVDIIEEDKMGAIKDAIEKDTDAYLLVYSCANRDSFKAASSALTLLKEEFKTDKSVVLVANKVDLARKMQVNHDEGRVLAHAYNCKYIETSAALNHNVDELLVGVLSQIRLKQYGQFVREQMMGKKHRSNKGLTRALKTAFKGVFGKKQKISSCENLYEV